MFSRLAVLVLCLALCPFTLNCASLISGKRQDVMITSTPPGAQATVFRLGDVPYVTPEEREKPGYAPPLVPPVQVAQTITPGSVLLARNDEYSVRLELEGYAPKEAKISRGINWWIIGNALFGLIGIAIGFAVDYGTGAAWRLTPDPLDVVLEAQAPAAGGQPPWRLVTVP
jgi:hypothetical protein